MFSFDISLGTFKDQVRLLSGDNVQTGESLDDESITAIQNFESNLFLAASHVARNIGMRMARRAFSVDTGANVQGGFKIDRRQQPEWWFKQAAALENRATNPAMNADEIVSSFAFSVDFYGLDWSDYGNSDLVYSDDRLLWSTF